MPKKILPSMFNKRCGFGTIKSVQSENSIGYKSEYVEQFSLWCYPKKRTLRQQYDLYGTELDDSLVLIVRHNSKINKQLKVKYNGEIYDILNISSDDSLNYMSYDYLTIKQIKKSGGKNG